MRSPELLRARRNHGGWVLVAERAKEESRGLEREEKSGELVVGGRGEQLMVTAMLPPSEPGGGR